MPRLQEPAEVCRHRKAPCVAVLRRADVEPDLAILEVDAAPLHLEDLIPDSPSRDPAELDNRSEFVGQVRHDGADLVGLEETGSRRWVVEEPNLWTPGQ